MSKPTYDQLLAHFNQVEEYKKTMSWELQKAHRIIMVMDWRATRGHLEEVPRSATVIHSEFGYIKHYYPKFAEWVREDNW